MDTHNCNIEAHDPRTRNVILFRYYHPRLVRLCIIFGYKAPTLICCTMKPRHLEGECWSRCSCPEKGYCSIFRTIGPQLLNAVRIRCTPIPQMKLLNVFVRLLTQLYVLERPALRGFGILPEPWSGSICAAGICMDATRIRFVVGPADMSVTTLVLPTHSVHALRCSWVGRRGRCSLAMARG